MSGGGYALDLVGPVRHVATMMDGAGSDGPAPTVRAMAEAYRGRGVISDLARIREHEGFLNDTAAREWLIRRALKELPTVQDGHMGYRLMVPFDELRFRGKPITRANVDEHARLGDPFNPLTNGIFADNIRKGPKRKAEEDNQLRESMRNFGWIDEFPAIVDERGVTISGHRRMRIAAELGIEPHIRTVKFGSGDEGDIARLRLAFASNEHKQFTKEDRKIISGYLADRGWSQASIAEALGVAQKTISLDLQERGNIIPGYNVSSSKSTGRPAKNADPKPNSADHPRILSAVRDAQSAGTFNAKRLAEELGVSRPTIDRARKNIEYADRPAPSAAPESSKSSHVHELVCRTCGAVVPG